MKKRIIFIVITFIHAALYIANNLFAYVTLPDLSYSDDIMTDVFGFGWTGLIITQLFLFILYSSFFYFSICVYKPKYPKKKFTEYIPTAAAAIGFAGYLTNMAVLIMIIIQWILINYFPYAYIWYLQYKYRFILKPTEFAEIIVFLILLTAWLVREYKIYKKETAK